MGLLAEPGQPSGTRLAAQDQTLFDAPAEHPQEIQRYSRALINGTNELLWIDLQSNVYIFKPLYEYILMEVVLTASRFSKVSMQARRDIAALVCRFFFFYKPAEALDYLLSQFPPSLSSAYFGGPSDIFVTEITNQLQKIRVEPVLLTYLQKTQALKGVELRTTTSIRLQSALYMLTSPGGPLFPTRPVRHAAWATLDTLYPVGRRFRHLISLGFRLLHPYYWPGSFMNFFVGMLEQVYHCMQRTILWPFGRRAYHNIQR
eukprot:SM000028S10205  [mRNA]  locus=s28:932255:936106:+ [translate_table: standard]